MLRPYTPLFKKLYKLKLFDARIIFNNCLLKYKTAKPLNVIIAYYTTDIIHRHYPESIEDNISHYEPMQPSCASKYDLSFLKELFSICRVILLKHKSKKGEFVLVNVCKVAPISYL